MDYEEQANEEATLVKYSNPILVIKNPEKPVSAGTLKVNIFIYTFHIQLLREQNTTTASVTSILKILSVS